MPSSKNCNPDQIGSGYNSSVNQPESLAHRRFTRQRKLRHLSDDDTGIHFHRHPQSTPLTPSSPDSLRIQRSMVGCSERWSSSAVPQPLPLPEFTSSWKAESPASYSSPGHYPSPQETPGRKSPCPVILNSAKILGNCQKKVPRDVNGDGVDVNCGQTLPMSRSSPITGSSGGTVSPRGSSRDDLYRSYVDTSSAECSNKYGRRLFQELNVERGGERLTLKVSSRSTPTSVLSSPVVSPRRSNTGDFYASFPDPQPFKDFPSSGAAKLLTPRISCSPPDRSPPHSPTAKSPLHSTRSPNGTAFALHHKPFQEISMDRPENNGYVNAYPLPLPPVPIVSSQPTMSHHAMDNPYASMMKDKWQKGKLIGRGTFGSVYLATNRETGALCAMKEVDLIADDPKSAECIKQLEQEIKVLHKLRHPNIVQYYGSERIDDHFYIYLEYVYPGSINKYIREHCGAMTESVVRNFSRHILSGLAYLHSKKTIHRDIKGANLLVDALGVVKLADFGMAKHLAGQYDLSLKGSPHWMAPEVIKASMQGRNPDLAFAVDIWSLGCTIIEMLNGKPPWSEFEGPSAMFKILNRNPPIPETISSEGKDFLHCCFRRNPAERPSANTLLEHPFLCHQHDDNVSFSSQALSTMNLHEKLASPNELARVKAPQTSSSPGIKITNRQCCSPSSSSSADAPLAAVNNHLFGISRNHGREVEHL